MASESVAQAAASRAEEGPTARSEGVLRATWPLMLAVLFCQLPSPAASIFVGPLSTDFGLAPTTVGAFRGLCGAAALIVGFLIAPLLDRVPRVLTVCVGMGLAASAATLPLVGSLALFVVSFLILGAATAMVIPAIQAACGDIFRGATAGRAASLVNAAQSLSGTMVGPILAPLALIGGWHAAYMGMVGAALVCALLVWLWLPYRRPEGVTRTGYIQAFRMIGRTPGAAMMLLSSTVRNCVTQAWLAFLAAAFTDRFDAGPGLIGLTWFLCSGSVSIGAIVTSRVATADGRGWHSSERVLLAGTIAMSLMVGLVYVAPSAPLAIGATFLFCCTVGTCTASQVAVLMHRYAALRGPVMGLNATGFNVGIVVGTSLSSLALALGSYPGLAIMLTTISLVSLGVLLLALRTGRDQPGDRTIIAAS